MLQYDLHVNVCAIRNKWFCTITYCCNISYSTILRFRMLLVIDAGGYKLLRTTNNVITIIDCRTTTVFGKNVGTHPKSFLFYRIYNATEE